MPRRLGIRKNSNHANGFQYRRCCCCCSLLLLLLLLGAAEDHFTIAFMGGYLFCCCLIHCECKVWAMVIGVNAGSKRQHASYCLRWQQSCVSEQDPRKTCVIVGATLLSSHSRLIAVAVPVWRFQRLLLQVWWHNRITWSRKIISDWNDN